MVAFALERGASIATASPLTSSFLPKCTHLLQVQIPHRPPTRPNFHGAVASTKQKKKARSSSSAREWSYEHLMVLWDEVFEQCCTDSVKATQIRDLSYRGLSKHGRGCVLVYQEVQTRPRGSGTGFTSKPPKSSRRVPDFVTLDWYAVYLPREFLLDPRKAPNEAEIANPEEKEPSDGAAYTVETLVDVRKDLDRKVDTSVDSRDVTIDVEEIIRDAQDVYRFDSDDDELDDNAEDVDSNDDFLSVFDDKEDGAAARRRIDSDSLLILDDGDDRATDVSTAACVSKKEYEAPLLILDDGDDRATDVSMAACISKEEYEAPLLIFDDGEAFVTTPPKVEAQNEEDASAGTAHFTSADMGAQAQYDVEDGAVDIAHDTMIEEAEHIEAHVVDNIHSSSFRVGTGKVEVQFKEEGGVSTAFGVVEANAVSVEVLEDGIEKAEMQFNGDASPYAAPNASGLDETSGDAVEVPEESIEANEMNGWGANEKASMGSQSTFSEGDQQSGEDDVQLASQQMLFASMRGMDLTRLMSLTANFDFEGENFRFGRKMAMIDTKTMDAGGEDPYNPKEDELVLLLHLVTDGRPAYGADVVIAYRNEAHVEFEKDSWKLKGKYKI